MLVLSGRDVDALLDLDALIDALATAMVDLSSGKISMPERVAAFVPERDGLLAAMPGYLPSAQMLMAKLVSVFPGNADAGVPTHSAAILCCDPVTGIPTALLDGSVITAVRTGAGSALSARLLANPDASVLAILGTGVQARSHARAICRVRPITQVRVAGRDPAKAAVLAGELAEQLPATVRVAESFAAAIEGADIVCATTHASSPIVRREDLSAGVHVTSVGVSSGGREVDDATVRDALVCVESRRAALAPFPAGTNDLLEPIGRGLIAADELCEIGELISGSRPGRERPDQITLYKSVGVAVQDAAASALVLAAARRTGAGVQIAL